MISRSDFPLGLKSLVNAVEAGDVSKGYKLQEWLVLLDGTLTFHPCHLQ